MGTMQGHRMVEDHPLAGCSKFATNAGRDPARFRASLLSIFSFQVSYGTLVYYLPFVTP